MWNLFSMALERYVKNVMQGKKSEMCSKSEKVVGSCWEVTLLWDVKEGKHKKQQGQQKLYVFKAKSGDETGKESRRYAAPGFN